MTESLTPTTHGNWHVIDGKLVDVKSEPVAITLPASIETTGMPVSENEIPGMEKTPDAIDTPRSFLKRSKPS